jgi:hypothetical protein
LIGAEERFPPSTVPVDYGGIKQGNPWLSLLRSRNQRKCEAVSPIPNFVPSMHPKAEPTLPNPEAEEFYSEAIRQLVLSDIPFLLAGTYAVSAYTGITRQTKDLDVFCKAADYPHILVHFKKLGHRIIIEDDRWLAKVFKGRTFLDVIFASSNGTMAIDDIWFEHARQTKVFGISVRVIGPTELIWSKCFVQARDRYDGADVAHLILKANDQIDWSRLLAYMDADWEILLIHLLNFRWIYPSDQTRIPDWLMDELLGRLAGQRQQPRSQPKICRGRLLSREDYEIDVTQWGFADVEGNGGSAP